MIRSAAQVAAFEEPTPAANPEGGSHLPRTSQTQREKSVRGRGDALC